MTGIISWGDTVVTEMFSLVIPCVYAGQVLHSPAYAWEAVTMIDRPVCQSWLVLIEPIRRQGRWGWQSVLAQSKQRKRRGAHEVGVEVVGGAATLGDRPHD